MATPLRAPQARVTEIDPTISNRDINNDLAAVTKKGQWLHFFYGEVFRTLSTDLPGKVTPANLETHKRVINRAWFQLRALSKSTAQITRDTSAIERKIPRVEFDSQVAEKIAQDQLEQIKKTHKYAVSQHLSLFSYLVQLNTERGDEAAPLLIGSPAPKKPVAARKDVAAPIVKASKALLWKLPMEAGFLMATIPSAVLRKSEPFFHNYPSIGKFFVPPLEVLENSPYTTPLLATGFAAWAAYKITPQKTKNRVYDAVNTAYDQVTVQLPAKVKETIEKTKRGWAYWCCCYCKKPGRVDSSMRRRLASVRRRREPSAESTASQANGAAAAAHPKTAPSLRDRAKQIFNAGKKGVETAGNVAQFLYTHWKPIGYTAGAIATAYVANSAIQTGLNFWNTVNLENIISSLPNVAAFEGVNFRNIVVS